MSATAQRRDYSGPADLRLMQGLVQRIWSWHSHLHIGDVAWQRSVNSGKDGWRTSLWEDDGRVVAWVWVRLPGRAQLAVDPARPELAAEALAWFRSVATAADLGCTVLEDEAHLISALTDAGFHRDDEAPFFTHHRISLSDLGTPVVPDGFILRHVRADEVERRAAAHRAAWSDWGPSKMTDEDMAAVMSCWPYRPELDWVVEAPNGDFAATALIWLDDVNQVGLVEPVGCAPEYRRRGLAQAVDLAALHALRDAGATDARVCPRGDDGYPQARALYQSIGFKPGPRTVFYTT
jgi:ribosomal protein S18 acetylase RimI-like enzyme